jgi:hypothetical protein
MNARTVTRRRTNGGILRSAGWLAAATMLAVAAFAPAAASAAVASNTVNSISVPSCFEGGMSGTLDVTVASSPFEFDLWVTDHVPGDGDWVEIPGSRITLSIDASDASYEFGPLDVSGHRDGVNSYRVESDGSNAKSASIHPCDDETTPPTNPPTNPPTTPPTNPPTTPPTNPPTTPPTNPPTTPPSNPPSSDPSNPPTNPTEPPAEESQVPTIDESPSEAPTGEVKGISGTPKTTLPPTDTMAAAGTSTNGSWRIVLAGIAGLIASLLLLSQPQRSRRSR